MDREEKLLIKEEQQKIAFDEADKGENYDLNNKVENDISPKDEKEIFTGEKIITTDNLSSNNMVYSNFPGSDVVEKINSLTLLPLKRQREVIASLHTLTETIGNTKAENLKLCPCCNKPIPIPYRFSKEFHSHELFEYGIDLINFNSLIKLLYRYVKYFWVISLTVAIITIFVNFSAYMTVIKDFFKFASGDRYLFFLDTIFFSMFTDLPLIILSGLYALLLVCLFLKILEKITLNLKKYRMNILHNKSIEETLFAVFVKGLPKLTDKEELKQFLEDEYKVIIRDIILLNDYTVLESLKTKLDYFYETGDVTKNQLDSILEQINHYANNIERNSCGIVIFEQTEDRLLFFREFFNLREILYMFFKRNFIYRGKRIYFEPVPSIRMIDWHNCKYSFEKIISNTKIQYVISFSVSAGLYGVVYYAIFMVSQLSIIDNDILNSLLINILLVILNVFLKLALVLFIASFKLSDNYLKEILKAYFISCRNVNNTVFINLLLYASGNKSEYTILFLIIFQNLKLGILSIFNFDFIFRTLSYKLYYNSKLNSQETLNDILGANTFNFMSTFEGFKLCFYLFIFCLMKSFTLGLFALSFLILHFYMIKYSFIHSRIRGFNKNYYGFYFSYIFSKEFVFTGKFFLFYVVALLFKNFRIVLISNLTSDFVFDIFISKSFYNKFYVKERYNNIKFTHKFENEKFVNLNLYLEQIDNTAQKIKKNL